MRANWLNSKYTLCMKKFNVLNRKLKAGVWITKVIQAIPTKSTTEEVEWLKAEGGGGLGGEGWR